MPNIDDMLKGARDAMSVRRVYGTAVEKDGVTVIPAAVVRGGGGGGGDAEQSGGGGFGLSASPVGAYVIKDGEVAWKPAIDPNRMTLGWQIVAGLAMVALLALARRRPR